MTDVIEATEMLAACLCAQLQIDESPEVCFCGLMPGAAIPVDVGSCKGGKCGMAYVRLTSIYSASEVGVLDLQPGNCAVGEGFDLEMGVFRCYKLMKDGGSPPPDVMLSATRQQIKDVQTMRRAIACCTWIPSKDFVVGQYAPTGPAGGVLGGTIPLSAWVP